MTGQVKFRGSPIFRHQRVLWLATSILAVPLVAQQAPNSWIAGRAMPTSRAFSFIGVVGQKIYVIGGANSSGILNVNEVYDTTTDTWTTAAPMPTARTTGASAVVNNVIYAMGGGVTGGGNATNTVEAYDSVTNTWSAKASMPTSNNSVYAVVENGLIYLIGGFNNNVRLTTVWAYNPATDSWTALAPLKVGKALSAVGLIGSTIVSAGGLSTDNTNGTADNEGYNALTNSWTTLAPMPAARFSACFETAGGMLYVAGGHSSTTAAPFTSMVAYNPVTNSWTSGLPAMPNAVTNPASASLGGRLYCFGGSNTGQLSGVTYNYLQIYQPPAQATPSILTGGIVNAASYAASNGVGAPVAPGALVAIFTSTLATQAANFNTPTLPDSLAGVSVTFNNVTAPIASVSPTGAFPFVSAQVPFEVLSPGQTSATVSTVLSVNNVPSAAAQTSIVPSAPGIFTIPATGQGNAILVFVNPSTNLATIAAPSTASIGYPTAPIPRGTDAFFYVTGLGAMTPPVADGSGHCPAPNGVCNANATPTVFVGGISAHVGFAGQAPEFPTVFQVNVTIPQSAPTGDSVSLVVKSADGSVTSNTATIAVQ
jgi:uncharacterized protein (TIGR03437 family)